VSAGNTDKGTSKSTAYAACHGRNGISSAPTFPGLMGQKEDYSVRAINSYKDGSRTNAMMAPMVASSSDEDIQNTAAY